MSNFNIHGDVTHSYMGDGGVQFVGAPQNVEAAFEAFRRAISRSPDAMTEEEFTSLEQELTAEQPSREKILSRIRVVAAVAGATGAIGQAADALSAAVHSWL
jgi:hypothetical protein